jgi:hypothetical protein
MMISPVDYDIRFSGMRADGSWRIEPGLVEEFSGNYRQLTQSGVGDPVELTDSLNRIFRTLDQQTENDLERRFLQELFDDLEAMVSHHLDFYSQRGIPRSYEQSERATRLGADGYYVTEISEQALNSIRRHAEPLLARLRSNASEGRVTRTDLSVNSGRVIRRIVRLLNREFRRSGVLGDLQHLLRGRPRVVGLALELSVSGSTWWQLPIASSEWPKTLYAHVDRAIDAPKSIVYLTDVGPENGPTSCYPSAYQQVAKNPLQDLVGRCLETIGRDADSPLHAYYQLAGQPLQNERFRGHFMRLPPELRFNSHFGWDVVPRSPLEDFLAATEFQVLGPAGTALVFDGAQLLHRGGLISEGERVVLQVVFGDPTLGQRVGKVLTFLGQKLRGH